MLVLARYPKQSIKIGKDISIMVVGVKANGQVRLGIEAPRDVAVFREEVFDRAQEERAKEVDGNR